MKIQLNLNLIIQKKYEDKYSFDSLMKNIKDKRDILEKNKKLIIYYLKNKIIEKLFKKINK